MNISSLVAYLSQHREQAFALIMHPSQQDGYGEDIAAMFPNVRVVYQEPRPTSVRGAMGVPDGIIAGHPQPSEFFLLKR